MEKAYDAKALVEKLKDEGMDVAEDAAKAVTKAVLDWVKESAKLSESTLDDLLVPVVELAEPHILKELDKIDGEEG